MQLFDYPQTRTCPYQPPPGFAELRRPGPLARVVLPSGDEAWVVTGHAEARLLLADPRISSDPTRPGFPDPSRRNGAPVYGPEVKRRTQTFVEMDEPEHGTHRRTLIPGFSVREVRALRPVLQEAADRLLTRLLANGPVVDLVAWYAAPLPSIMLCHLLGLPPDNHAYFRDRADAAVLDKRHAGASLGELRGYFERLLAGRPADGVLGHLVKRGEQAGLDPAVMANTCVMLVVAGHETSTNMIALGTLALLTHPRRLEALRDDPGCLPGAVEELLRFVAIPETLVRMAVADIEIAGHLIRAGDAVLVLPAAANRDPRAFPAPDVLDQERQARHHLAFGYGVHQCLGQNLARLELEIAFSTLLRRVPTLRLAVPVTQVEGSGPGGLQGVAELPVAW